MIEYKWNIKDLAVADKADKSKVVTRIVWDLEATDGTSITTLGGNLYLPAPVADASFLPYEELTHDQVVEWVKIVLKFDTHLSVELEHRLAELTSPKKLPWHK